MSNPRVDWHPEFPEDNDPLLEEQEEANLRDLFGGLRNALSKGVPSESGAAKVSPPGKPPPS